MSGLRPSTTGCYLNGQNWRPGISEDKLLNSHFARAGYRVYGAGKIYHGAADRGGDWTDYFPGEGGTRRHPDAKDDGVGGIRFYPLANSDEEMPDYSVVSYGLEKLKAKSDQPFFLAIGLVKPHMPFSVPKKWFDMFPLESIELPPHREDDLDDVPPAGVKMAGPNGDHAKIVESGRWKEAVQAYLATIAFCDAQVGRLLDGLETVAASRQHDRLLVERSRLEPGREIALAEFALWEEPTRTVFVWKVPGVTQPGGVCERTVDYTCIYPTLCELAGLPLPTHLDGRSLVPLLKDPKSAWDSPGHHHARVQEPRRAHGRLALHPLRQRRRRAVRRSRRSARVHEPRRRPEHAARKSELAKWLPKIDAANLPQASERGREEQQTKRKPKQRL